MGLYVESASGAATPFRAVASGFLDPTGDRRGEAARLKAVRLVFRREGNEVALVATFAAVIGAFLCREQTLGISRFRTAHLSGTLLACSERWRGERAP